MSLGQWCPVRDGTRQFGQNPVNKSGDIGNIEFVWVVDGWWWVACGGDVKSFSHKTQLW